MLLSAASEAVMPRIAVRLVARRVFFMVVPFLSVELLTRVPGWSG